MLNEVTDYIFNERGEEVISETHEPDFSNKPEQNSDSDEELSKELSNGSNTYTDLNFEDI